jgi:nucleoside-diphosphate kinase
MTEKTFTIVKPDSTEKGNIGAILSMIEGAGFRILAMRQTRMNEAVAQRFYIEHKDKPFYGSLVRYMTSGPVVVAVLERENAIKGLRELMGATNPKEAAEGTVRSKFGESIERNAIHGSANADDARREVGFFFGEADLV